MMGFVIFYMFYLGVCKFMYLSTILCLLNVGHFVHSTVAAFYYVAVGLSDSNVG